MDRVDRALVAGLGLVALWTFSGAQGARVGSWAIPTISPWWVVGAAAAVLLLARQRTSAPGRGRVIGIALAVSLLLILFFRSQALYPRTSLDFIVDGEREVRSETLQIDQRSELRRLTGKRRNVTLEIRSVLEVPRSGSYVLDVTCDDSCEVVLGNDVLGVEGTRSVALPLETGDIPLEIHYRQEGGPARLALSWDTPSFLELLPIDYYVRSPTGERRSRFDVHLSLAMLSVWFVAFGLYLVLLGRGRSRWKAKPLVPAALASLVVLYGCALRFESLLAHSGLAERDGFYSLAHQALLPWLPGFGVLNPENAPEDPYRADVRSYLDRAESMTLTEFYAPSFREPFYVLLSRVGVTLAGGEIGILIQSFVFSCLTLPLFWLVARTLHGPWWAVLLLVPVSVHEWLVLEAPTGYRMSAYSFFFLGLVAHLASGRESPRAAAFGGTVGGLLTLIRLSALSAITPVLALRLWSIPRPNRPFYAAAFVLVLSIVVGPFLLSNFRTHGDPFYSVSFHTEFWLRAEGLDRGQGRVSLTSYFSDFGRSSQVVKGTALGLTVLPLRTFWNGLRFFPLLGVVTIALGTLGLVTVSKGVNRYFAAAYFGHLLPFAYIQNFPSGEMPRFVMPAFYLLVLGIPAAMASALTLLRRPANVKNVSRTVLLLAAVLTALPARSDDRVERLPAKYRDWIEKEVVYIIADRERDAFLDLQSGFWSRRGHRRPKRLTCSSPLFGDLARALEAKTQFRQFVSNYTKGPSARFVDADAAPGVPTLVLSGVITEYEGGSQATRYLVGFGAGKTRTYCLFQLVDKATGEVVFERMENGSISGGLFGGSSSGAMKELGEDIAKAINNNW